MNRRLAVALMSLALIPARGACEASAGAAFLGVTPSARAYSLGMGTALTALGAEAIGANPANLGLQPHRFSLFTSYARLFEGTDHQHLAAAFARRGQETGIDAVGVSATRLAANGLQTAGADGVRTGASFSSSDLAVSLSLSARASPGLRIGVTGKLIQSQIGDYRSRSAPAADAGLAYTVGGGRRPVTLALGATNVGPGVRFLEQTDPLPTAVGAGAALPVGRFLLILDMSRRLRSGENRASVGVEYGLGAVSFRAGYLAQQGSNNLAARGARGGSALGALAAGIGVRAGSARLDYAMSQQAADFGATQRISLSMHWGSRAAAPARAWKKNYDRSDWIIQPIGGY